MARRSQRKSAKPARRVSKQSATTPVSPWPNIAWLIDDGGAITIGTEKPIGCIASAADEHICYAMLLRRPGESIEALLSRLDQAIVTASETDLPVDEINPPPTSRRS